MNKYFVRVSAFGGLVNFNATVGVTEVPDMEDFEPALLCAALDGFYPTFIAPYERYDNEGAVERATDVYYNTGELVYWEPAK